MTTALIDADHLIYSCAAGCEKDIRWDESVHTLHSDFNDVRQAISSKVETIRQNAAAEAVVLCFSDYPYFRSEILPGYKANRIGRRRPLALGDAIDWAKEAFVSRSLPGLEADDVMGLLGSANVASMVVACVDKDLRTVPCRLMPDREIETISEAAANRAWMMQTLHGDSTDGYSGLPKVGPVAAAKILEGATTLPEMWEAVLAAYRKAGLGYKEALATARVARILRAGDYDFHAISSHALRLWEPAVDPAFQ